MSLASWHRRFFARAPQQIEPGNTQDADVQFALGVMCAADKESSRDLEQALEWYRKAAEQEHALAQFNLGIMLASGQGVSRDAIAAHHWTRRSAEGGDAGAQFKLGSSYHRSSLDQFQMDRVESRIEAYKWFQLSAAQGYAGAAAGGERVTLAMTRDEVADGNKRVASFVARKPRGPLALSSTSAR